MSRRRPVDPEDVLTVLVHFFQYEVYNIGDSGVVLTKDLAGRRRSVIALPYGTPRVPADVVDHVVQRADFTAVDFWAALDQYLES